MPEVEAMSLLWEWPTAPVTQGSIGMSQSCKFLWPRDGNGSMGRAVYPGRVVCER